MAKFSYIGRKGMGEKEVGVLEGVNQDDVLLQLQKKGLVIISLIPLDSVKKEERPITETQKAKRQFTHTGIKDSDLVLFIRQLAMLLGAGVSLLRSLDIITKQVDSRKLFDVIKKVHDDMEGGLTLRDSLAKFPVIFTPLWLNLVETGEASGNLPTVLDKLAYYLEEAASFKRKIISAMMYPGILLCVSFGAVIFFILKIVPTFAGILTSFGVELPLMTRMVIGLSEFLGKKSFLFIVMVVGGVIGFKKLSVRPPFNRMIEDMCFKLPVLGEFMRFLLLERFSMTMSILVESGVPILYALEISERSAGSLRLAETIQFVKKSVKEGRSMAEPMEKSEFFTPMVVQMIAIGEEIGELSNMLKKISRYYQEYLETFIVRLASIIEPLMIVFVGIIIGALVISIFLPIFSIASMKTG